MSIQPLISHNYPFVVGDLSPHAHNESSKL